MKVRCINDVVIYGSLTFGKIYVVTKQYENGSYRIIDDMGRSLMCSSCNFEIVGRNNTDMINNPPHYAQDEIECIDVVKQNCKHLDGFEGAMYANITKYTWRFKHKNGIEDLEKAKWYLERLIKYEEGKNELP